MEIANNNYLLILVVVVTRQPNCRLGHYGLSGHFYSQPDNLQAVLKHVQNNLHNNGYKIEDIQGTIRGPLNSQENSQRRLKFSCNAVKFSGNTKLKLFINNPRNLCERKRSLRSVFCTKIGEGLIIYLKYTTFRIFKITVHI